jgi:hypothetical protein
VVTRKHILFFSHFLSSFFIGLNRCQLIPVGSLVIGHRSGEIFGVVGTRSPKSWEKALCSLRHPAFSAAAAASVTSGFHDILGYGSLVPSFLPSLLARAPSLPRRSCCSSVSLIERASFLLQRCLSVAWHRLRASSERVSERVSWRGPPPSLSPSLRPFSFSCLRSRPFPGQEQNSKRAL